MSQGQVLVVPQVERLLELNQLQRLVRVNRIHDPRDSIGATRVERALGDAEGALRLTQRPLPTGSSPVINQCSLDRE